MAIYDREFYRSYANIVQRSAAVVVPLVIELAKPGSVVDVGCGVGTWLRAFADNGVDDYVGIDGDYVSVFDLNIPENSFKQVDLRHGFNLERRFDLACSLEVAEHLPPGIACGFVSALVQAAPLVLFSAAIPGQGGKNHINEQWQSYWAERFAYHGYEAIDCIRPKVYGHPDVAWWYQQNLIMFCASGRRPAGCEPVRTAYALDRAHPQVLRNLVNGPRSGHEAIRAIRGGASFLVRKAKEEISQKARRR